MVLGLEFWVQGSEIRVYGFGMESSGACGLGFSILGQALGV